MRKVAMLCAAVVLIGGVLFQPESVLNSAKDALAVWYASVFPALFPFFIGTSLMIRCGAMDGLPRGALPIAVGAVAGSPAGIRCAAEIGAPQRASLMSLGMSAAFVTATVGGAFMRSVEVGWLIFACQCAALWICGAIPPRCFGIGEPIGANIATKTSGIIPEAVRAMLVIAGYMAACAALAAAITAFLPNIPLLKACIYAVIEVANGSARIAQLPIARETRVVLLTACASFSGLSIILQSLPYARARGIGLCSVLAFKTAHAVLATVFAIIALKFTNMQAFSPNLRFESGITPTLTVWAIYALSLLTTLLILSRGKTG